MMNMFILFLMIASAVAWPNGRYSLPTPKTGCPPGWAYGRRYQDNEDTHNINSVTPGHHFHGYTCNGSIYWDDEDNANINLKWGVLPDGNYGRNTKIQYCCRSDGSAYSYINLPTSKPFYLYQYTSTCQRVRGMTVSQESVKMDDRNNRFRTGSIYWDDEDHANANTKNGVPPDGTYDRNTRIYYCCRSDGPSYSSIVLPTSKPFYLYHYTSTVCQRVRGMSAREEFVKTDDEDTHNNSADGGNHPKKTDTTRIHYCYYS
ncbi:unnamed protein product [Mytilus edulis]|uniref:Apextrin C-terminal domain-containing protein n=1 Tax=Mytilus edulis TaxID=6550 RepID=A0A8S3SD14_MYTED|nr:unnamed protein product [Mytilus edulis]